MRDKLTGFCKLIHLHFTHADFSLTELWQVKSWSSTKGVRCHPRNIFQSSRLNLSLCKNHGNYAHLCWQPYSQPFPTCSLPQHTPKFCLAKSSLNIIFNSCGNSAFPLWNIFHALTVWNTVNVQDCSRTIVSQNLRAFYKPSLLARLCLLWLLVCLDHPETNTRDTR